MHTSLILYPVPPLAAQGVDLNAVDPGGYTAIILASARGHRYCVELLVLSGANVNAQNTVRRST